MPKIRPQVTPVEHLFLGRALLFRRSPVLWVAFTPPGK